MSKLNVLLTNLNNSELIEYKVDIDKVKGIPVNLKKSRDVVEKDAVKKKQYMISQLQKLNVIDTSESVKK